MARRCRKSVDRRNKYTGILGVATGFDPEDFDYDDSSDENYEPGGSEEGPSSPPARAPSRRLKRGAQGKGKGKGRAVTTKTRTAPVNMGGIVSLSREVVLTNIIRPHLDSKAKCALARCCRFLKACTDDPSAWEELDISAPVIGVTVTKSGRQSVLSRYPLFMLARSIVAQPRFSRVRSVALQGLNLGASGQPPTLLLELFEHCRGITRLNLWHSYVEDERLPQPDVAIEEAIVANLPGIEHLALNVYTSSRGLKILLSGCHELKSLHLGGSPTSLYPNDHGMRAFEQSNCSKLEALTLYGKDNVGAAGLRSVLSSCPALRHLAILQCQRIGIRTLTQASHPPQASSNLRHLMGNLHTLILDGVRCPSAASENTMRELGEACSAVRTLTLADSSNAGGGQGNVRWDGLVKSGALFYSPQSPAEALTIHRADDACVRAHMDAFTGRAPQGHATAAATEAGAADLRTLVIETRGMTELWTISGGAPPPAVRLLPPRGDDFMMDWQVAFSTGLQADAAGAGESADAALGRVRFKAQPVGPDDRIAAYFRL